MTSTLSRSLIFILILVGLNSAFGQDNPKKAEDTAEKLVTIHAEDAHLPSVLAILADRSGYNIVTGPAVNVQDKISLHLVDVPIEQAVNLVVRAAGLSYELVGNSFLIASPNRLKEEVGIKSYVVPLQYAAAADIKELLQNLTDQIEVDAGGNKLLINTSPKKISEIMDVVKSVDVPVLQIRLEARLIEVAVKDEQQLGIDWTKLAKITTILAETAAPPLPGWGSLVPGMTQQLQSNGQIMQNYSSLPTGQIPNNMYYQRITGFDDVGHYSRQLSAFDVTLDFLLKNNKADVLANSQVVTLNGR
ncbi:MAG: secretin and TonB N-terminal domain-containing protein, partial [Candidatus Marinimicrobia bacterium]|nr:secretin and TonB N-terminal domain-containing protein [Candidatus Neomarinimicrobiota bacterium]